MPINVVVSGVTIPYPLTGETGWGNNATKFATQVASTTLQLAGGNFSILSDVNFSANGFGLISPYYKSSTSNIASAGVLRLASSDTIDFRNNANSGNIALSKDSSDNLLWNGNIISPSGAGPVTSITGTANEIIASASTGAVTLSTPQGIGTGSSPTFSGLTLSSLSTAGIVHNTVTTGQLTSSLIVNADVSSSAAIAVSKLAALTDSTMLYSNSSGVITSTSAPTNGQLLIGSTGTIPALGTLTGTTNQISVSNGAGSITLSTPLTSAETYTLPSTRGTNGYFLQTDGSTATLVWAPGGSGTISSGTTNHLSYYSGSTTLSDASGASLTGLYKLSDSSGSGDQLNISSGSSGNWGLLTFAADNIQQYFDAHFNGSSVIADATSAFRIRKSSGSLEIDGNAGLTVGNSFTPTSLLNVDTSGNLSLNVASSALQLLGGTTNAYVEGGQTFYIGNNRTSAGTIPNASYSVANININSTTSASNVSIYAASAVNTAGSLVAVFAKPTSAGIAALSLTTSGTSSATIGSFSVSSDNGGFQIASRDTAGVNTSFITIADCLYWTNFALIAYTGGVGVATDLIHYPNSATTPTVISSINAAGWSGGARTYQVVSGGASNVLQVKFANSNSSNCNVTVLNNNS